MADLPKPVAQVQRMGSYQGVPAYGCLLTIEAEKRLKVNDPLFSLAELDAYAAQAVAQERERYVELKREFEALCKDHTAMMEAADELVNSPQPAPAGWRLVPEEATAEMLEASHHWLSALDMRLCWRYVLAAAPQPPSAWRPIEKAPENQEILILGRDGSRCAAMFKRESYGLWWCPVGFGGHEWEWSWETATEPWRGATHWQPLPPPPSAGEEPST
jgi:hypothetical protein